MSGSVRSRAPAGGASASMGTGGFSSFWQAGFEGADHVNEHGQPLSMIESTGHLQRLEDDYAALGEFGIRTIRESVGWRLSESSRGFDFDHVVRRAEAAKHNGLQVLWALCHYGIPDDLDYFDEEFVPRFVRFCDAVARVLKPHFGADELFHYYTPVNEISFLSWAICEAPSFSSRYRGQPGQAYALKKRLVEATLRGMDAIRAVDPQARLLCVDPLVHVVAPPQHPEWAEQAAAESELQFQAWDMLCGRTEPQLGGSEAAVSVAGLNYYPPNQWEFGTQRRLSWHLNDPRRRLLRELIRDFAARYRMPLALSETSHVGMGRSLWVEEIAAEVRAAVETRIPVLGVCLYPIVDRPAWSDPDQWHRCGLWDVDDARESLPRRLDPAYADGLRSAQRRLPINPEPDIPDKETSMPTLIVFSHLRWDFVYQRPQHLLSRIARHRRILFVEEPVFNEDASTLEILAPVPNVRVLRPHTPVRESGFHDLQMPHLVPALKRHLQAENCTDYSIWFYTPMALPALRSFAPKAIFYDCMDELGAFRGAPPQLAAREMTLMRLANAVFAGGPSLYERKRAQSERVHCFPSSVDVAHFARAKTNSSVHPLLDGLAHPRLGFFGVLDERLDAGLIEYLADERPHWQLCLVGPVAKIDPATLPVRSNIHYYPMQSYAALPDFLAGWDVCILPFARNEATRFISPTKTLEYLAAGKPVVSTDIADVAALYADSVWIASDRPGFLAAC